MEIFRQIRLATIQTDKYFPCQVFSHAIFNVV